MIRGRRVRAACLTLHGFPPEMLTTDDELTTLRHYLETLRN